MGSPHYTPTGKPRADVTGFSQDMRQEFVKIETVIETLKLLPLTWSTENAHAGGNHDEYFAIPFKCRIIDIFAIISATNGASSMATFIYTPGGLLTNPAWNFLASEPAETIDKVLDESYTDSLRDVDAGAFLRLNIQGDNVSVVPMNVTFVVTPRV